MRHLIPSWIRVTVIFFLIFGFTEYIIDSGEKPAFIEYPAVMLFLLLVLLILIAIESIVGAFENIMLHKLDEEAKARFLAEKKSKSNWFGNIYKKLAGGEPIEKEGEIILDHNYDGIKELDNNLPPWWIYSFYISIVFAAIYLLRYHVFVDSSSNQFEELETELAEAKTAIEEYKKNAKDLVDAESVTLLTDAADLSAGKEIFQTNCVACHMADGGGGIGPNLTDQYWILGGDIKHVFTTVSEGGRSGKGMIAWKAQLKPAQIAQVSSYVLSLQGTTPANPKDAEGDLWVDENADAGTAIEETTQVVVDSTQTAALN